MGGAAVEELARHLTQVWLARVCQVMRWVGGRRLRSLTHPTVSGNNTRVSVATETRKVTENTHRSCSDKKSKLELDRKHLQLSKILTLE
jgi:hypothetical protein